MELLAPAGNWEGFKAVLAQKPDVIYLGAGDLNARSEEAQFALADLPDLVAQARLVGTKIHFTLNVLIKDDEMARALEIADQAYQAGVAAVIVQDKGLMSALHAHLPGLVIHASTQCSVGSREQILELLDLGVQRVVLARELSLDQIADLTAYAHSLGLEVEVFVHGATCMSVSGQCHLSFCRGGRSANRGACAQPCRLSYQIWENDKPLRDYAAYLSPKDLSYFPYLKDLSKVGVDSLKIEGRLRSPEYQAQVTAIFKQALTEINQAFSEPEMALPDSQIFTPERERNLTIAFNRGGGFQAAFLRNQRDASFLSADQVGHYGYYLGQVTEIKDRQGILLYELDEEYLPSPGSQISLKNADGVSVASAPVGVVRRSKIPGKVEIKGFHPRILRKLRLPLTVWQQKQDRVADQDLREQAAPSKEGLWMRLSRPAPAEPDRQIVAQAQIKETSPQTIEHGGPSSSGQGARNYLLELKTATQAVSICSEELENTPQDTGSPLDLDRIYKQLGKLGNTPYQLVGFETDLEPEDLPRWRISDLNAFRRAGLAKLQDAPEQAKSQATAPQVEAASNYGKRGAMSNSGKSRQVEKIVYLTNYQAGDDLSALSGKAGELYVLPLEELGQAVRQNLLTWELSPAAWGAYISPLRAWSCETSIEACLKNLAGKGLSALVSSTSGLVELVAQSGSDQELADKLGLYLWQGGQISNRQSYKFLSNRGYDGLMISPELSQGGQEDLAAACSSLGRQRARPILLVSGPLEAMFTRFCPVGYSRGLKACGLCRGETKKSGQKQAPSYALKDEDGRRFPLTPKALADCSLQIWESGSRSWQPGVDCILGFNYLSRDLSRLRDLLDKY